MCYVRSNHNAVPENKTAPAVLSHIETVVATFGDAQQFLQAKKAA